jgi:dsRNA-specific ribonuclease
VEVAVDGDVVGSGEGRSRREAETHAAEAALERIDAQAAEAVTP